MIVIPGSSNPQLAEAIAARLQVKLGRVAIGKFPNGEKRIWIRSPLSGETVIIVQSFSQPVDEHIIELCLLTNAASLLKASRIIALVPWLGYSPQDQPFRVGEPVSIQVIAKIIAAVSVDHLITLDIHSKKALDFFTIPHLEVSARPLFVDYLRSLDLANAVIVAVDQGSRARASHIASDLNLPLCLFEKTRDRHTGAISLRHVSGEVKGKVAISFDDFVSTGATRIAASLILKRLGATKFIDCITHAVLAGDSAAKLEASSIDSVITTDSYPIPPHKRFPKLTVVSSADLLAAAIDKLTR
jgi:ribose-phosphate pyrophosphokinase